jgi:hypothetical protein
VHQGRVIRFSDSGLESIRVPGNVCEIGTGALAGLSSLRDLSFDEGILKIGESAFSAISKMEKAAFPASLIIIEADAFRVCEKLHQISFAVGSQLQRIRRAAFAESPLDEFALPASIAELSPSAFSYNVLCDSVRFEGPPPLFSIDDDFVLSADSRVLFAFLSDGPVLIGSKVEVIDVTARYSGSSIMFETGSRLSEIRTEAFWNCSSLTAINIPESVEILADSCFALCSKMTTIEFEGSSRLKIIGERVFFKLRAAAFNHNSGIDGENRWINICSLSIVIDPSCSSQ